MNRSLPTSEPTTDLLGDAVIEADIEKALDDLGVPAPAGLTDRTLVAVGLADAYGPLDTVIGPIWVAFNGLGVSALESAESGPAFEARFQASHGRPAHPLDELPPRLTAAIQRRLGGDRRVSIPLDLRGHSAFEKDVWLKALEIPRGEVRPYGWIAAEIGRPKAVRAVGTALGHNPVPLVVPCHRVVRTRRDARPVLARRAGQQAGAAGLRGPRSGWAGGPGPVRRPLHRLGHDPDLLPADLP